MIAVGQCADAAIDGFHIILLVEKVSKLCRKAELFHSPYCRGIAKEGVKVAALLQLIVICTSEKERSTWLMVAVADMLWRQLNNDDFAIF